MCQRLRCGETQVNETYQRHEAVICHGMEKERKSDPCCCMWCSIKTQAARLNSCDTSKLGVLAAPNELCQQTRTKTSPSAKMAAMFCTSTKIRLFLRIGMPMIVHMSYRSNSIPKRLSTTIMRISGLVSTQSHLVCMTHSSSSSSSSCTSSSACEALPSSPASSLSSYPPNSGS